MIWLYVMGLPRKNIFWRPCLWRMSQAMNVYSLRTSCTISPPRPHEKKKKRKNDLWSRVPYTDLFFFSPVMDQKSIFFFTPALFPIHNRLHLTMNEPHDSVFYWLYRFGWFFNMYLTKSISLGGHFHQRKLWEIANADIGILLPKLFWPTVRKNCSSDREKCWNSRLKAENL